ncbi:MAG TPA: sugar ABC transporter ATP-binding protein [Candidatus Methylomirabilis sp.]|nr:sugar ABC transporter ATP-binding protein [Candidatus Methylomirabilis sp.]
MEPPTYILEARGISKAFPGVRALNGVDLALCAGEIHALVGENGAGKSTLMRVFDGIYQPDSGEIRIDGRVVQIDSPHRAILLGVSMVHQEPKLALPLSIAENIFMGRLPTKGQGRVDWPRLNANARELLGSLGLDLDPRTPAIGLSIAHRQLVQIAKALSYRTRVIILDEPSASITPVELETLFGVLLRLKARGVGLIYISHRLDEVFRIADTVTVLKDGRRVAAMPVAQIDKSGLIALMVGRKLGYTFPPKRQRAGEIVLEVRGFSGEGFRNISFTARRGEILGIAGLVGAGRTEMIRAIFGAELPAQGELSLHGRRVRVSSPRDAIRLGIGYLAEDRRDSLIMPLSVRENITVATPEKVSRYGLFDGVRQRAIAQEYVAKLNVRTPTIEQLVLNLSGGNQQKVAFAKWLVKGTEVLIFDEPTRGIDVGAKVEIYLLLDQLAREGKAIIMISSELVEILGMSDRVLVISEGRLVGELPGEGATEERILELAIPHSTRESSHA